MYTKDNLTEDLKNLEQQTQDAQAQLKVMQDNLLRLDGATRLCRGQLQVLEQMEARKAQEEASKTVEPSAEPISAAA